MIRRALRTYLALNAAIPVTLGTLRAWHERGYRRNVAAIALSAADLRADLLDHLEAELTHDLGAVRAMRGAL